MKKNVSRVLLAFGSGDNELQTIGLCAVLFSVYCMQRKDKKEISFLVSVEAPHPQ